MRKREITMEQVKTGVCVSFIVAMLGFVAMMAAGCNPEYIAKAGDKIEYELTDETSGLQQGVETSAAVTEQLKTTLQLVPFVPYAKEAAAGLGIFSLILNALQALRGVKLKKAVKEIVTGAEAFKEAPGMPSEFVGVFKDKQDAAQSADTKIMVATIKAAK